MGSPGFASNLREKTSMHKKLMASAATSLLLLGASSVAMAQTFPPFVVLSVQATLDVEVPPIVVGGPCVDAVQALRLVPLPLQHIDVIQESFLTFVMGNRTTGSEAILVCGPQGTAPPAPPAG
jgi:hypothetical protein